MQKQTHIRIESLQLIKDSKTFFSTDKVLSVEVFDTTGMPISNLEKIKLRNNGKAFDYAGRLYMIILFKGSPENFFLNGKNGIPWKIGNVDVLFFFDGKLSEMLAQKKIYDISYCYKKSGGDFRAEFNFLIERYIDPYVPVDGTYKKQSSRFSFPGNISVQEV
jgi:hypothetical protein